MPAPQKRHIGRCDALSLNMRALASAPLLSAAEEISLARQVQRGRQLHEVKEEMTLRSGGRAPSLGEWALEAGMAPQQLQRCLMHAERARSRMVVANLRLVISLARRYPHRPGELEDLIQDGTIGLIKAVERFDPSRGYRFSTYATWWIRDGIGSALVNNARAIRLPATMLDQLHRLRQSQQSLGQQLGRDPSLAEVLFRAQEPLSLEAQSGSDSQLKLLETLACQASNPQDQLTRTLLQQDIARLFKALPDSEATLLRFRYGLDAEQPLSLSATARRMGISRDSARGLERRANAAIRRLSLDYLPYLEA